MGDWAEMEKDAYGDAEFHLQSRHPEVFGSHRRSAAARRAYGAVDRHHFLFNDQTWTTKDGEILNIEDMTPSHRANTLAMLRRKYGDFIDTTPLGKRLAREDTP